MSPIRRHGLLLNGWFAWLGIAMLPTAAGSPRQAAGGPEPVAWLAVRARRGGAGPAATVALWQNLIVGLAITVFVVNAS